MRARIQSLRKSLISIDRLLHDLRALIVEARQDVARQVNSAPVLLYWRIGQRIQQGILKEKRAEYGEQIVSAVQRQFSWTHCKQIIYLELQKIKKLACLGFGTR